MFANNLGFNLQKFSSKLYDCILIRTQTHISELALKLLSTISLCRIRCATDNIRNTNQFINLILDGIRCSISFIECLDDWSNIEDIDCAFKTSFLSEVLEAFYGDQSTVIRLFEQASQFRY